jgi:hypothetical protein
MEGIAFVTTAFVSKSWLLGALPFKAQENAHEQ